MEWTRKEMRAIIDFNPKESIKKGSLARKIPMTCLDVFSRKINGSEEAIYSSGPKFRNGDTLLARITPCLENGKTAYVDILDEEEVAFGSTEFIILRAKPETDKDYLYYLARSPTFRKRAISCMEGTSGRKRVNDKALQVQELPVPGLSEQKAIGNMLSSIDAKIDLNNRINTELESLARTIYDYWFLQFDFPDAEGRPYRSSGGVIFDELPTGWTKGNIMELAELLGGGTPSKAKSEYWGGDIPFFTPTDAKGEVFSFSTDSNTTAEGIANCSSKLFDEGTIFITARGSVGRLAIAGTKMGMNQSCYALKPKHGVSSAYLFFKTENLIEHLKVKSSGSVFNSIVSNDIAWTLLSIPPTKIIEDFSKVVNPMFKQISILTQENAELSALRDWLLPLLMSGEVRVGE